MDLTEEERDILVKFKGKVSDVMKAHHVDFYLLKWLKARQFNIDKAESMYRKSMAWRGEIGADTILDEWEVPAVMKKYYPGGIMGRDMEGNIVYIDPFGQLDLKGIMRAVKKADIMKTMVYRLEMIERLARQGTTDEKPIHQCVHLQDLSGFSSRIMFKAGLMLVIDILKMMQENYPDLLKCTYVINAPKMFIVGYNFIKHVINKDTAKKFRFLGANWQEEVFKAIPLTTLPKYYGGEVVDDTGDPKCSQIICYGGDVPRSDYQTEGGVFSQDSRTKTTVIGFKGSFSIPLMATTMTCFIKWMFYTENGDITFSILQDKFGELETIRAPEKLDCDLIPQDGVIQCDGIGKYVLRFVNSSYMSSRKLIYFAEVLDSEQITVSKELVEKQLSSTS